VSNLTVLSLGAATTSLSAILDPPLVLLRYQNSYICHNKKNPRSVFDSETLVGWTATLPVEAYLKEKKTKWIRIKSDRSHAFFYDVFCSWWFWTWFTASSVQGHRTTWAMGWSFFYFIFNFFKLT
jgi:hypothetical protein